MLDDATVHVVATKEVWSSDEARKALDAGYELTIFTNDPIEKNKQIGVRVKAAGMHKDRYQWMGSTNFELLKWDELVKRLPFYAEENADDVSLQSEPTPEEIDDMINRQLGCGKIWK